MPANHKRIRKREESSAERWAREAKEQARKTAKINPAELEYREERAMQAVRANLRIPDDFPLELTAKIAAQLLQGDDYAKAANRALSLLQECKQRLKANKEAKESYLAAFMHANVSPDFEVPEGLFKVPFGPAIKKVTGQKRSDRAETDYLTFLEATNPSQNKAERTAALKIEEREGIDAALVQKLSARFEKLRDEGKLGKRRRPEKGL